MANTKAKKTTSAKSAKGADTDTASKDKTTVEKLVPKDVDINEFIMVKNGFQGKLVYISKRTNEEFVWDNFGDMQEIEIRELRNAKSSAKAFFINNWFMFDEEDMWVVDFLGVSQYYENAVPIEEFDDIFEKPIDEARETIEKMSNGQRNSLGYRARQKVVNGEIDSRKMISMLEEVLGIELIEK